MSESDVIRRHKIHAFKITKIYKLLLFIDLLDERILVAVEWALDDIIAQLPLPIKKEIWDLKQGTVYVYILKLFYPVCFHKSW